MNWQKKLGVTCISCHQVSMKLLPYQLIMGSPDDLAEMVYEINMDQVDINDRLSNQVYCYDKDLRTLRLATDTINKSLDDVDRGAISTPEREGR